MPLTQVTQLQQAAERTQLSTAAVAAKLAAAHAQVVLLHRFAVPNVSCPVVLQVPNLSVHELAEVLTA